MLVVSSLLPTWVTQVQVLRPAHIHFEFMLKMEVRNCYYNQTMNPASVINNTQACGKTCYNAIVLIKIFTRFSMPEYSENDDEMT